MPALWTDVRYGFRVLRASPGFTAVAALTLALGIAANTAVFSWIHSVLLHPIPGAANDHELAVLETVRRDGRGMAISFPEFRDYRDNLTLLSGLAVHRFALFTLETQPVWGELVSGNYFAVLGVKPLAGRFFLPSEYGDTPGAYPVAVISERLWRARFRSDPGIAGTTVHLNRFPITIVGVAPASFHGSVTVAAFDLWVPLTMRPQLGGESAESLNNRNARAWQSFARLKPGVTLEQARAEVIAQARRLAAVYPEPGQSAPATLVAMSEAANSAHRLLLGPLQVLMALCVVVLLIVCANVANLLLARSLARRTELAVRMALGARPWRVARQLLTESVLLAGLGAALAVPLALWLGSAMVWLLPPVSLPVALDTRVNAEILAFTILVTAAAAVLASVAPVLYSFRAGLNESLKEGGRAGSGERGGRTRSLLVVSEVALAAVALAGAGLFMKSFRLARGAQPGFDPSNAAVCRFYLASSGYSDEQQKQFALRLRDRLKAAPGMADATYAHMLPLGMGGAPSTGVDVEGYAPARGESTSVFYNQVAPGYFSMLRIPLLEGRDFTTADAPATAPVMIVNQAFARRFYGGANPVGRRVRLWNRWTTVVGQVKDSKYLSLAEATMPYFYLPFAQVYRGGLDTSIGFYVRSASGPAPALEALRREAAAIDPAVPLFEAAPLEEFIGGSLYPQKLAASLLAVLGCLALLLAAVGLYSVMAFAVGRRTQEIGLRMALGAQPRQVLAAVIGNGMALAGIGLAAGILAALAAARLVAGMLLHVAPADPVVFGLAALVLSAVALLASYIPARRATRIDPMAALRYQ